MLLIRQRTFDADAGPPAEEPSSSLEMEKGKEEEAPPVMLVRQQTFDAEVPSSSPQKETEKEKEEAPPMLLVRQQTFDAESHAAVDPSQGARRNSQDGLDSLTDRIRASSAVDKFEKMEGMIGELKGRLDGAAAPTSTAEQTAAPAESTLTADSTQENDGEDGGGWEDDAEDGWDDDASDLESDGGENGDLNEDEQNSGPDAEAGGGGPALQTEVELEAAVGAMAVEVEAEVVSLEEAMALPSSPVAENEEAAPRTFGTVSEEDVQWLNESQGSIAVAEEDGGVQNEAVEAVTTTREEEEFSFRSGDGDRKGAAAVEAGSSAPPMEEQGDVDGDGEALSGPQASRSTVSSPQTDITTANTTTATDTNNADGNVMVMVDNDGEALSGAQEARQRQPPSGFLSGSDGSVDVSREGVKGAASFFEQKIAEQSPEVQRQHEDTVRRESEERQSGRHKTSPWGSGIRPPGFGKRPSFLPSFLLFVRPSFLPSFYLFALPSLLRAILSYFLPSFLPSIVSSCPPSLLFSFLPFFLPSFLPSFLPFGLVRTYTSSLPSTHPSPFLPSFLLPSFHPSVLPSLPFSSLLPFLDLGPTIFLPSFPPFPLRPVIFLSSFLPSSIP
jgi:hypothetical protein